MGPSALRNVLTLLLGAVLVALALSVVRCDASSSYKFSDTDQESSETSRASN